MAPSGEEVLLPLAKKRSLDTASISGSSTASDESSPRKKRKDRKNGKKKHGDTAVDGAKPRADEKRTLDTASVSGSSTSSDDSSRRKKRKDRKNGKKKHSVAYDAAVNGAKPSAFEKRRNSLGKAARDPRDEPPPKKRATAPDGHAEVVTRSPSPMINYDGLSRPSRGTKERREETEEQAAQRLERMSGAVRTLLECIGEDPDREGLLDTPKRYAKALLDFTKGYQQNLLEVSNGALFEEGHRELIIVRDIEIYSMCEHHMVPFTGKIHIGYIPNNTVIGLSKIPRIAEMFARRLQIQERLTKEVAHAIMEILKPQGVAVIMESSHLCMVMRGVQKTSSSTITSCVLGCFERKSKTRNEFLSLVGVSR